MNEHLMQTVLPRLARPLYLQLEQFQTGQMTEGQFNESFEAVLDKEHARLSKSGLSKARAAILIHACVLILSRPGLESEAEEMHVPFEIVEKQALDDAAWDVVQRFGAPHRKVAARLATLVAQFEK